MWSWKIPEPQKSLLFLIVVFAALVLEAQQQDTTYVSSDKVKLFTVLTRPEQPENAPLAVIIAGSGPTDLNGNQPNLQNNSLKYLSDDLAEQGIATVRFDKRGIGKSSSFPESEMTINQFADDVVTIIDYYKKYGFTDIYIIGHSEGSLIGLIAIQRITLKGFISIAGAGSPADEILKKQLQPQLPPIWYDRVVSMIDSLKNHHEVHNVAPSLQVLFRPSVQPYLMSWFDYDPTELIAQLNCPVLVVQGDQDIQVDIEEAKKLEQMAKDGELKIISRMNHVLKTVEGGRQANVATYSDPMLPVIPKLVQTISTFIHRVND